MITDEYISVMCDLGYHERCHGRCDCPCHDPIGYVTRNPEDVS